MSELSGYHSEWNLGSPGGWDYQRMAQVLGKMAWENIRALTRIDIELDFDHPILNPLPAFAQLLLRAHRRRAGREKPCLALVAEKETLEKVGENIHFIDYLTRKEGVSAVLTSPERIEERGGKITCEGKKLTLIFLDFNNNVLARLRKKYNLNGLLKAIKNRMVVNPRGMEPIGAKGVFELVTGKCRDLMSDTTVLRTPWTRQFYPRSTTGPEGEKIADLVEWVRTNWENIILKPVHGYSGKGIILGYQSKNRDRDIEQALNSRGYIVQKLIPLSLWAEEYPWVDHEKAFIKRWQTDFRCFITNQGLMGFVTRFGNVPTNVGSGGGVQSSAILLSPLPVKEAVNRLNEVMVKLGHSVLSEIQSQLDRKSIEMGNVYLLGPIMTTLRPRIITPGQVRELNHYAFNLWKDAVELARIWEKGEIDEYVEISSDEEEIARMCPWRGEEALIASDGLFNFGGGLED